MVVYLNFVKGIPIQPSKIDGHFKNIFGGTTNECLCLTRNDELYLVELVDRAPVLSKISDNVKTASHGITDTNELIAYYVTKTANSGIIIHTINIKYNQFRNLDARDYIPLPILSMKMSD